MKIIDTHCHLDFNDFDHDREQVLNRARASNVSAFIIPAVQRTTWDALISLCDETEDFYYALGLHPMFVDCHLPQHLEELKDYVLVNKPIAIGEIGLDFFEPTRDQEKQIEIFESQLKLAAEMSLPVILHVRKAHEQVLSCLKKYPVKAGVVHAFNGSVQLAERYKTYNLKFGFGGMLTYSRSTKLRKLAKSLPLTDIVLETDSPDMAVEQHRGERNSPEYLSFCLQSLAEVKSLSIEEVAEVTTNNVHDVFNLT